MMMMSFILDINNKKYYLPKPCVMGIINVSPHSFFQALPNFSDALKMAENMIEQGASIIDIGAVATNPAVRDIHTVSSEAECESIIPLIQAIRKKSDVLISVDTSSPLVMQRSVEVGASMINDQRGLHESGALEMVTKLQVPICLMHHFNPSRQPDSCSTENLLFTIKSDLERDVQRCLNAGILRDRIMIDPGLGGGHFGKSSDENFYLLAHLKTFVDFTFPVLVGLSRKSMLGGKTAAERLPASLAAAFFAAQQGTAILRVHDVKETVAVVQVIYKLRHKIDFPLPLAGEG